MGLIEYIKDFLTSSWDRLASIRSGTLLITGLVSIGILYPDKLFIPLWVAAPLKEIEPAASLALYFCIIRIPVISYQGLSSKLRKYIEQEKKHKEKLVQEKETSLEIQRGQCELFPHIESNDIITINNLIRSYNLGKPFTIDTYGYSGQYSTNNQRFILELLRLQLVIKKDHPSYIDGFYQPTEKLVELYGNYTDAAKQRYLDRTKHHKT